MRRLLLLPVALTVGLLAGGCAHSEGAARDVPKGPPIQTEVEVTGLKKEERDVLEKQVCALPQVSECKITVEEPKPSKAAAAKKSKKPKKPKKGRKAKKEAEPEEAPAEAPVDDPVMPRRLKLTFVYGGTLPELRAALAGLPHPGLKVQTTTVHLTYEGFDNIPPDVTLREPDDGAVFTVPEVTVVLEVPAADLESVTIEGEGVKASEPGVYQRVLKLPDGNHVLAAVATDQAGNREQVEVSVLVDTTPPALRVKVLKQGGDRAVLSGEVEDAAKVTIDGLDVPIRSFGNFSKNLPADPDMTKVEVVATDEHGNESRLTVQLEDGWTGTAGPGTPDG